LERALSIDQNSANHAATYASNGLRGGGIPKGTNSGSTRVPLYMVLDAHDSPNTNVVATDAVTTMDGTTCIVQEELPMIDYRVEPPPLNPVEDCDQTPPSLFSPEQMELIFEIRGYMMEQLHRHTLISSYIDMLFDTFSNALAKQRCSTCTQPYVLKPSDGTLHSGSLDGRFHYSHSPSNV
jgi:hypothetical protein